MTNGEIDVWQDVRGVRWVCGYKVFGFGHFYLSLQTKYDYLFTRMEEKATQTVCKPTTSDCTVCGKCTTREEQARQQGLTLYTILVYSENIAGVLNQITAVFTRRQVNIESLNVCASSTPGVHKYTITCYCTLEMVKMLKKQIEKRIDVIQARYFTDDDIFILETSLLKLSTPMMLENADVCRMVRLHGARIVEVNPTYSTVEKTGMTEDILNLYDSLNRLGCVLQFVRSGRIAITKSYREQLDAYLAEREMEREQK